MSPLSQPFATTALGCQVWKSTYDPRYEASLSAPACPSLTNIRKELSLLVRPFSLSQWAPSHPSGFSQVCTRVDKCAQESQVCTSRDGSSYGHGDSGPYCNAIPRVLSASTHTHAFAETLIPVVLFSTLVYTCALLCTPVHTCAHLCTLVHKHWCMMYRFVHIVHKCAQVCTSVHNCAQVCTSMHK